MSEPTYTREQVSAAVNAGADLVLDELLDGADERDTDLINLVANAALTLLDTPDADLDDVIEENYDADDNPRDRWGG